MSDGGRWRRVYALEWYASAFQNLSDAERVVYFYARTGSQSTSTGIYRMSAAVAVEDIGNLTTTEFHQRLDVVCQAFGWRFDPSTRVLWMPGWLQENPPQSPNVVVSWRKLFANLPDCDLKFEAAESVKDFLKGKEEGFRKEFPKDFLKNPSQPKAQPKSQPEANQGAGEQGNQGNQGSESRGTRSAKKAGFEHNGNGGVSALPPHLEQIARETFQLIGTNRPEDERVDLFIDIGRRSHAVTSSRSEAITAMNFVLNQRRSVTA